MSGQLPLLHLPQCPSTNDYCKQHAGELPHFGAVYTTNQTAGRGRLGRSWQGRPGDGLYFSMVFHGSLKDPACLPLASGLAVAAALKKVSGTAAQIKWPNDLLLGNQKICGILCEGTTLQRQNAPPEPVIVCGIGINLTQPLAYFKAAGLAHATSLQTFLSAPLPDGFAHTLAAAVQNELCQNPAMRAFYAEGFGAVRDEYAARCVNLNRPVTFEGGSGIATDVDAAGRLVVQTENGSRHVFTGEVSVQGIYGQL